LAQYCYVYIITAEGKESPCKVGLSLDPWARVRTLQTGCPERIVVREIYGCETRREAEALESAFHTANAAHRGIGEWFAMANYWLFHASVGPDIDRLYA
jgi:hypothetical protein